MIRADEIAGFLDSKHKGIQRINFILDWGVCRLEVSPEGFKKVADALRNENIKVEELTHGVKLPDNISLSETLAGYLYSNNTLYIKSGVVIQAQQTQSTIIHECTHAIVDGYNLGSVTMSSNEAAAFIAEGVFRLANNIIDWGDIPVEIRKSAWPIVNQIYKGNGKVYRIPKDDQLTTLINAVSSYYQMPPNEVGPDSDGIPGVILELSFQKPQRKDSTRPR